MEHRECKFEDRVIKMSEDISKLLTEFRGMNGTLRDTKRRFDLHSEESDTYRQKTTTIWTTLIVLKYVVFVIIGTGMITQFVKWWVTK